MKTLAQHHPNRINARIDEARAVKLEDLRRATGLSVSDIIKRGIDLLHQEIDKPSRSAFEILTETSFIGSGEGSGDLSETYKDELTKLLASKHDPGFWPAR